MPDFKGQSNTDDLKNIDKQAFFSFGREHIGYIKEVTAHDRRTYALFAADGKLLTTQNSFNDAVLAAHDQNIWPVTVH